MNTTVILFAALLSGEPAQATATSPYPAPAQPPAATPPVTAYPGPAAQPATPAQPAQPAVQATPPQPAQPATPAPTVKAATPATKTGAVSLAASTKKKILEVRIDGVTVKRYDVSVGTKVHPTPTGGFTIRHIVWNPSWVPPKEKWAKGKKPAPPGDPDNPMKVVKLFFQEPDYYIHGTDKDDSLGSAASHGCIRMSEADVEQLARFVMQRGGAPKSDAWFSGVMSGGKPADVRLPIAIPIVIGP